MLMESGVDKRGSVLECASPLALSARMSFADMMESGGGPPQSRTLLRLPCPNQFGTFTKRHNKTKTRRLATFAFVENRFAQRRTLKFSGALGISWAHG